jgi:hypothetical protein
MQPRRTGHAATRQRKLRGIASAAARRTAIVRSEPDLLPGMDEGADAHRLELRNSIGRLQPL